VQETVDSAATSLGKFLRRMGPLLDTRNDLHISSSAGILDGLDHTKDKVVSFGATIEAVHVSSQTLGLM
jgi:hypothetical protein